MTKPKLLVELVFLSSEEGGRQSPPAFGTPAEYRPHFVVQDRGVRHARMRGNFIEDDYLSVSFVEGPGKVTFGEPVKCVVRLNYFPDVAYGDLREGATFTVREGARVVAHGIVLERRPAG
jgi:translation elongation factor EF-Tu-like GTPase